MVIKKSKVWFWRPYKSYTRYQITQANLRRPVTHEASKAEEQQLNMAQLTYCRLSHFLRLSANKPTVLRMPTEIDHGLACLQFIRCQVRLMLIFHCVFFDNTLMINSS